MPRGYTGWMATLRVLVRGRVQGVGFRQFILQEAQKAGVSGEVWNKMDRTVEARISHPDPIVVHELAEKLRGGPGWVQAVVTEPDVEQEFDGFRIVYRP